MHFAYNHLKQRQLKNWDLATDLRKTHEKSSAIIFRIFLALTLLLANFNSKILVRSTCLLGLYWELTAEIV